MAPNITAFIIDGDLASRKIIEESLKALDRVAVVGTAGDFDSGYEGVLRNRPMLVVIDLDINPELACRTMEKMLERFAGLSIFATSSDSSSENILRAIRCGASEFLLRPVGPKDLFNSLRKIGRLSMPGREGDEDAHGKVITCFSPKGGMGNTTVATNLAVSLHQTTGKGVVLVDLDLESGDTDIFLNLKPKYTISDVTTNISRLDAAFLQGVLARHGSGIYLLAEPKTVVEAEGVTPNQVREVLGLLKKLFSYVVVDTQDVYGELNLAAFDASDLILTVGILSLPAIRNLQKALDVFDRLGMGKDKVKLVINRYLKKGEISIEDAEKTLGYDVFRFLPNDFFSVMSSINRGQPLATLLPHSEIGRAYRDFALEVGHYFAPKMEKAGI